MMVEKRPIGPPPTGGAGRDKDQNDNWRIEAIPADLIESPLDFIFAEHHRQREAAAILTMIADGEFNRGGIEDLIKFLEEDFEFHIADEEIAFFPVLREHCLKEDNVDAVMNRLVEEHRKDESSAEETIALLNSLLAGRPLADNEKRRVRLFAEHIRQHLALENGVLLPIARVRLRTAELELLTDMFKQRRRTQRAQL